MSNEFLHLDCLVTCPIHYRKSRPSVLYFSPLSFASAAKFSHSKYFPETNIIKGKLNYHLFCSSFFSVIFFPYFECFREQTERKRTSTHTLTHSLTKNAILIFIVYLSHLQIVPIQTFNKYRVATTTIIHQVLDVVHSWALQLECN